MTRVTRAIGFALFVFFLAAETVFVADFLALVTALFADFFALVTVFLALFFALAAFLVALRFMPATWLDARFFNAGRFFSAGRLARFVAFLLPDFARDFLAFFIAIVLLLGVGDEIPRIAGFGR
jgi:hypothetical protein